MKRAAIVTVLALVLASPAHGATTPPGVNIRWDHCFADSGVSNRLFACDTNIGVERLVMSFELADTLAGVAGLELSVYLQAAEPALPDWWQFRTVGSCRQQELSLDLAPPPGTVGCVDWGQGNQAGGIGSYVTDYDGIPGKVLTNLAVAVPSSAAANLSAGMEYFAGTLQITHRKTVGSTACGGCSTPMCIVLGLVRVQTTDFANGISLLQGANGVESQIASWQSATTLNLSTGCHMTCHATFDCVPTSTPTRNSTWGAVKALYR